jgi:hypothetical protein
MHPFYQMDLGSDQPLLMMKAGDALPTQNGQFIHMSMDDLRVALQDWVKKTHGWVVPVKPKDLSHAQWDILCWLRIQRNSATPTEIARAVGGKSISGLRRGSAWACPKLRSLVDKGYVEKIVYTYGVYYDDVLPESYYPGE